MPAALAPVRLVCFGPPTILVDGHDAPREAQWQKHLALLIYLSLSPKQKRARDHLLGVFWSEKPDQKARHALNEAVRRLRKALGTGRLRSEGDVLVLSNEGLEVDALRFVASADATPEDALALLAGDFLEGFHVENAPEFDSWMAQERERYHTLAVSALVAAGEKRLVGRRFDQATDSARRALGFSPRSEQAASLLMRASALAGEAAVALAAYREFANRLKEDTGETPSPALVALADRIRAQHGPAPKPAVAAVEAPLVGRDSQHTAVFESVADGLIRGPKVMAITSAPGMGRTRLLDECARRLSLGGALVLRARCIETDQDTRWSVLRMLARAGLVGAPGLSGASPDSLSALAALAPALGERFAPRDVRDVAEMGAALGDVFGAVADERPLALLLDDAHWADGPSLAALGAALTAIAPARVLLLLTAAEGIGTPSRELVRLRSEVGRAVPGVVMRLDALSQEDIGRLVLALATWTRDDAERDRLTRRLVIESGGNPFIAVTLIGALGKAERLRASLTAWPAPERTFDASLPFSVPSLLRDALVVILKELTAQQLAILGAGSVSGDPFDLELIAQILDRPVAQIELDLPESEKRHLITFDGGRYTFTAPVIADVVRAECFTPGELRRLEKRAGEALAARPDLESRVRRVSLRAQASPDRNVGEEALALAREATSAGMPVSARRALKAAERALSASPDSTLQQQMADLRNDLRAQR